MTKSDHETEDFKYHLHHEDNVMDEGSPVAMSC